jgi:acetamidase/formamidase
MLQEPKMRANRTEYLFSVNTHTPTTMSVQSGEEFTIEVRGALDDVEDIRAVPTPFMPACDGHPLAAIIGPIEVRGAKPGDVVAIDLIELISFGYCGDFDQKDAGQGEPDLAPSSGQ